MAQLEPLALEAFPQAGGDGRRTHGQNPALAAVVAAKRRRNPVGRLQVVALHAELLVGVADDDDRPPGPRTSVARFTKWPTSQSAGGGSGLPPIRWSTTTAGSGRAPQKSPVRTFAIRVAGAAAAASISAQTCSDVHGPATGMAESADPDRSSIASASGGAAVPAVSGTAARGISTR